jgi:hypothetical protein
MRVIDTDGNGVHTAAALEDTGISKSSEVSVLIPIFLLYYSISPCDTYKYKE